MQTVNIKGKEYVMVHERLKYFRTNYPHFSLESEITHLADGACIIRAVVKDPEGRIRATGMGCENRASTQINKTSYIENCETSAWGRALGNFGIGIDASVATSEEVENAILQQENDFTEGGE